LFVVVPHQGLHKASIFAFPERLRVKPQVHVKSADMWHLMVVQKEPRHDATYHRVLAMEATENLPYFHKYRFHSLCCAILIFICGLWV